MKSGAQPDNKNRQKLTNEGMRKMAFDQYIDHLRKGYPKRTFVFRHPLATLTWKSMEKYIRDYPLELPSSHIEAAMAEGEQSWIVEGRQMMRGEMEGKTQPVIYQIMMRNIYKWDREESERTVVKSEAETLLKRWKGQESDED